MERKYFLTIGIWFVLMTGIFISCSKKSAVQKDAVIGILPYKGFPVEKTDSVSKAIEKYYGLKTVVLPLHELPKEAFINIKSPRYRADSLISIQLRHKPDSVDYILGLTHKDISVPKRDNKGNIKKPEWKYNDFGIMGLEYRPGKSCVVSTFRLKTINNTLHFTRLKKVALHEFGHNLGLPHCPDKKCVMTNAMESIKTIDNAYPYLCDNCKNKIFK